MTKSILLAGLFYLILLSCRQKSGSDQKVIKLPISFQNGFGSFGSTYGILFPLFSPEDPDRSPWNAMYSQLKGIPKEWKNVVKSNVWLDPYQLVYQHYQQGNVDSAIYLALQKSWEWIPDESRLSKVPIRSEVYVVRGLDESGNATVIIDTDNDLDFSDETPFHPQVGDRDSLRFYKPSHDIEYDVLKNGQVETRRIKMVVRYMPDEPLDQNYWYSFPQYGVTNLRVKGKVHQISINMGFNSPWAEFSEIILPEKLLPNQIVRVGQGISKGAIFEIDGERFKNLGMDVQANLLRLEGVSNTENIDINEVGFKFKPFQANEFLSNKIISSNEYRGKYLFIDFWGTWCKPCVSALPELKVIHKKLDKDRVQFIGIAGNNSAEQLKIFLNRAPIPWPQILSDKNNKLIETYNIVAFPSTILIGPDGTIIAKNVYGREIEEILKKHNCMKM